MVKVIQAIFYLAIVLLSMGKPVHAGDLRLPEDPQQNIRYWKPHVISADKDPQVALAHRIFARLLRGWDQSRLEPDLYVVESTNGPWAASLADGNILLSREAIRICHQAGKNREQHLLAFVLSHELAHQRSDDLWHQRFIRLIGNTQSNDHSQWLTDIQSKDAAALQNIEAQADHDGLILMASVGYDPYAILDHKDFYTTWVESIWGESCQKNQSSELQALCQQAGQRARRTRAQLAVVADQSVIYELGVQAFVAGQYSQARQYFKLFAREYTSHALLAAIASTYLAEALEIQAQINGINPEKQVDFYYPLMLDASYQAAPAVSVDNKRASIDITLAALKIQRHKKITSAVNFFEKAIHLEPDNRRSYLQLALAYLLDGNTYMARGVIQGQYIPAFHQDDTTTLAMAMINAAEGNQKPASRLFRQLTRQFLTHLPSDNDVIVYSGFYNATAYAVFQGNKTGAQQLWKQLAKVASKQVHPGLFQLALLQLKKHRTAIHQAAKNIRIDGMALGQTLAVSHKDARPVWIEGEEYQLVRKPDGSRLVVDKNQRIQNLWVMNTEITGHRLPDFTGDATRPLIALGMPERQLYLPSGEYLAYDRYGLAIQLQGNQVAGWFLYQPVKK